MFFNLIFHKIFFLIWSLQNKYVIISVLPLIYVTIEINKSNAII